MTQVRGAQEGTPEFLCNEKHITIRNPIERLNGVLKVDFVHYYVTELKIIVSIQSTMS